MATLATNTTVRINGGPDLRCGFRVETQQIDVTSMLGLSEPDHAWQFIDTAGHYHSFDRDGRLPTLKEEAEYVGPEWTTEYGDEVELRRWMICKLCSEEIAPKYLYVPPPERQLIPGRTDYHLTVFGETLPEGTFSVVVTWSGRVRYFGIGRAAGNETYESGRPVSSEILIEGMWPRRAPFPAPDPT